MSKPNQPSPAPDGPPDALASQQGHDRRRLLRSEELLQGQVEVLIEHGAEVYRLRLTRSGKLILQK
ncbi:MAG TPA: hemin uptake protein HemP [Pirellulales bacterium]|jgi:hemin uptake protein HemP|nr:hemin uptake protein HemP [Pirellulales bacterium]